MNDALARNLSAVELAKFATDELDGICLLIDRPDYIAELVARVDQLAMKADQLDALLDDNTFAEANEVAVFIDKVKDVADKFGVDDIYELEKELAELKETMDEFDPVNANDICSELKRLKKLAQRIEQACTEACIEITF